MHIRNQYIFCAIFALIRGTSVCILLVYRFLYRALLSESKEIFSCRCVGGCAEEIVQAEARGKGQGRQGCRCFALDLCFECKLKVLEMSAIGRDMAVERQMCVKGTKEAYEVMVGCFCGSDIVGGGLRCAGCKGVVCLFQRRDPMIRDVEMGVHQA